MSRRFTFLVVVALAAGVTASAPFAVSSAVEPAGTGAPVTILTTFAGDAHVWGSIDGAGSAASTRTASSPATPPAAQAPRRCA